MLDVVLIFTPTNTSEINELASSSISLVHKLREMKVITRLHPQGKGGPLGPTRVCKIEFKFDRKQFYTDATDNATQI